MAEDKFGNPLDDSRAPSEPSRVDPDRLYAGDRDLGRSNSSIGWIVGAVVLLGVMVYAFGWKVDDRTADSDTAPITTGQNVPPIARPAPTPGPVAPAPNLTPAPTPSTTGAAPVQ